MNSNKVVVMETNEDTESTKDNDNVVQEEPDMVKSMCFWFLKN